MASYAQKPRNSVGWRQDPAARMLLLIAWAALAGAVISWAYYWDPTRVVFKTLTADSPYRYEEIDPKIAAVDPARHLTVDAGEDLTVRRRAVRESIWGAGGLPADIKPRLVTANALRDLEARACPTERPEVEIYLPLACAKGRYEGASGLARIEAWAVPISSDYRALYALFRPEESNGRLVIYHHGFAGTYHDYHPYILRLVRAGYTVIAHNLAGFGDNRFFGPKPARTGNDGQDGQDALPYHVYFTPVIASLNQARSENAYASIAMIGFSAGGWVTTVSAALDTRIDRSYVVAGALPVYMRGVREGADIFLHPKLLREATYLDLFLMGAAGKERAQIQIFNRYDRCCYQNTRGKLYESLIQDRLAKRGNGQFEVWIDESHARHKLSATGFRRILQDLAAHGKPKADEK